MIGHQQSRSESGDLQDGWRRRESNPRTSPTACDGRRRDGTACPHPGRALTSCLNLCWRHELQVRNTLYQDFLLWSEPDSGWVYFGVRGDRPGEVKIGWSRNYLKRVQAQGLEPIMVLSEATRSYEHDLHVQFADWRTTGEWFRYEGAVRDFVFERTCIEERQVV